MRKLALLSACLLAACSDDPETLPADSGGSSTQDAGTAGDLGTSPPDADPTDSGEIEGDAGGEPADAGVADTGTMPGEPITVPADTWTWVGFEDSFCDDGTTTGIGIRTSTSSSNVLLYFNGGGACWDYDTCFVFNTAVHGPFGETQFNRLAGGLDVGAFERGNAANVFRDWNQVFIPYCTGDVHAGDNIVTYTSGNDSRMYHHKGHANFSAFVRRLAATFPNPDKLVVSGSSAGGFGATFNYTTARAYWPNGQVYLINDSGPTFRSTNPALIDAWIESWNMGPTIDALCGTECRDDFSLAYTRLSERYPNDRLALLSSLQDQVIRSYFGVTPQAFEAALLELATEVIDPLPNYEYFFIEGSSHTMLGSPQDFVSNGTDLFEWMKLQVTDDPGWTSTAP